MELEPLESINSRQWDKTISSFENKALFHQSAWLDFIEKTQGGKKVLLKIEENGEIIGYLAAFILRKGPFKILGSPLIGWGTDFMGPIVNRDFDQLAFLDALEKYCRFQKIDHLELSIPILSPEIMRAHFFQCQQGNTLIVDLSPDETIMWKNLKKNSCQWAIRKAQKNNLIVEDTEDSKIIHYYYNQLKEVFAKKRLVPSYSYDKPKVLFDCLKKEDLLFAMQVKYNDEVIATGLFPHDDKCLYFWGGSSASKYHYLCPNDLLQWTVMLLAAKRGISKYNMEGVSDFKSKFGGNLTSTYHWYKSYNPLAKVARLVYQHQFKILQKIKGLTYRSLILLPQRGRSKQQ